MVKIKPLTLKIPDEVKTTLQGNRISFVGPKGEYTVSVGLQIEVALVDNQIILGRTKDDKKIRAIHGLEKALITNAIKGVTEGFTKTLELSGVGYRALVSDDELTLSVGFSHPVKFQAPPGITFAASENKIKIWGIDKQLVGQIAHTIRSVRPPEPYKGKGIKYEGEKIRKKAGKAAAKAVGVK